MTKKNQDDIFFKKILRRQHIRSTRIYLDQLKLTCQIPDLGHETLKPSKKKIKNY
jgi:hypothetical protein